MYNKIILIGNLTKDPELKYTPQGTPVCNFRIAVNTKVKKDNDYVDQPLFIGVVTFGKRAESLGQYLVKGRAVVVEGRLQERRWEADGQQRSIMEVIASDIKFLPKGGNTSGTQHQDEAHVPEEVTDIEPF